MRLAHWPAALTIALTMVVPFAVLCTSDARSVAILVPRPSGLAAAIRAVAAADGAIAGATAGRILFARSDQAGFTARLYAEGAWLVLPSFGFGCGETLPRETELLPRRATP